MSSAAGTVPVLAIDIGGTKINAAVVVGAEVGPVATGSTPSRDGGAAVLAETVRVAREALALWQQLPAQPSQCSAPIHGAEHAPGVAAIGVASAGVIDSHRGIVTAATDAIRGWAGTDLGGALSREFALPVRVLNDVHAHGLGEATWGAGRDQSSLLLVAVGTGVGGAFVADGVVVTGSHGAGGHVGHVSVVEADGIPCTCGRIGHLEGLASGPGIAAELTRRGVTAASTRDVAALANDPSHQGSDAALDVLHLAGSATGRAIGGLLNVLDPAVVAITGGVASAEGTAGDTWWSALLEGVQDDAMDVVCETPIVRAYAGNHAALLGAAVFATTAARGPETVHER